MDHPDLDTRLYRRTMGLFATGVAVLTTRSAAHAVVAMTANSVTSVSLEPLLLLVCVNREAHIATHLMEAETFCLSFLAEDQGALSDYFAGISRLPEPPAFRFVEWEGGSRLEDCIGAVGCRRSQVLEGGDHWIVLGDVMALHRPDNPAPPLVFWGGQYRRLAPPDEGAPR